MNPQTSRGKRSSSLQKEEPTKRRAEKAKEERADTSSSDSKEEVSSSVKWENIGDKEEMYLAGTREELYELIMRKETFEHKAMRKTTEVLMGLARSLLIYSRESIEELQLAQPEEEKVSPDERSQIGKSTAVITFQHRRMVWLAETLFERYRQRRAKVFLCERTIEGLRKESVQLRKSLEETTKERDELLGRVNSQRMEVEKRDVSVSTETAIPDVEMAEDPTLSSDPQDIPQSLVGTLEEVIERKMEEILSRVGFPMEGKTKGLKNSGKSKAQTPTKDISTWSEVVKRSRGKPSTQREAISSYGEKEREPKSTERLEKRGKKKKRKEWPTLPKTAAVVLTAPAGKEAACAELLRRAKEEISIEEIEVPPLEIRRARTGGLILGVPGQRSQEGADRLAAKLAGLARDMGVKISRPMKKADLRVSGLDESATVEDVRAAVVGMTGCRASDIRCGQVQSSPAGVGSLWLQCPVEAAVKVAKEGRLRVGWAGASVEMLRARPQRCYRCLEVGHLGARCTSAVDRALRCYRCGTPGHKAGDCREEVLRCPLCMDTGRAHNHVLGGPGCYVPPPPQRQTRAEVSAVVTPSGIT